MLTEFKNVLRRSRGAMLGWGLSLGGLGFFMMGFYDTLEEQRAMLEQLIAQYPPELMAFFGGNSTANLFTPAGYLTMEFFSLMPVVLGIFGVMAGSSLLAGDEENGLLDLVMAYPVSRSNLFFGRLLGFALTLAVILGLTWLAFVAGIGTTSMDVTALELLFPFVSLYAVVFLFGGLSLLLSMLLPSRGMAGMLGGMLMVASYFIHSLAGINDSLEKVAEYLPLKYYQSGYAIDGLNSDWVWLLGFGLLFAILAWLLFLRRDIRVSGEGNWRFSFAGAGSRK